MEMNPNVSSPYVLLNFVDDRGRCRRLFFSDPAEVIVSVGKVGSGVLPGTVFIERRFPGPEKAKTPDPPRLGALSIRREGECPPSRHVIMMTRDQFWMQSTPVSDVLLNI